MSVLAPLSPFRDWLEGFAGDDRALAYLEMNRHRAFSRLTPARRIACIDEALAIGKEAAGKFDGGDVAKIAASLGIRVRFDHGPNEIAGRSLRAEYDAGDRAVVLYQRSIEQTSHLLGETLSPVAALYLAHELFHHLQFHSPWQTIPRRPADGVTLSPHASEIAAHAFARALTRFPVPPSLLDTLLLIQQRLLDLESWEQSVRHARAAVGEPARPLPSYPPGYGRGSLSSGPRE